MKLEAVKHFFELIETFSISESDFKPLLHPEIEQTEFPNLITPGVVVSNFEVLMQRIPNGKKLLKEQKYDSAGLRSRRDPDHRSNLDGRGRSGCWCV